MNENQIAKILESLEKSSDKVFIHRQLVKLRTDVVKNNEGIQKFLKLGGVKICVKLLDVLKEQVLEVDLSILGNCCTIDKCRQEAFNHGIVRKLMTVLSLNNSVIQNRGFRLMGNLAMTPAIGKALHKASATFFISKALDTETNHVIQLMVIRALRNLWALKEFQTEAISQQCISLIVKLLRNTLKKEDYKPESPEEIVKNLIGQESEWEGSSLKDMFQMPESKEKLELINGIFKFLLEVVSNLSPEISCQIYTNGYDSLVFLSSENSQFRIYVLKILGNLCWDAWANRFLSAHDVVVHAANLLAKKDTLTVPLTQEEQRYCLIIVCVACGNACDRNKLKRSNFLNILVDITKNSTCPKEISLILFGLYQFRFDDLGLRYLIEIGIINVLIKLIADILKNKEVEHITFADAENDESVNKEFDEREMRGNKRVNISNSPQLYENVSLKL